MEYFLCLVFGSLLCSTLFAIFTTWSLYIGLGLFGLFVLEIVSSNLTLRNDHSGDAGIPYLFFVLIPTLSLSVSFLLTTLIKFIVTKSL